MFSPTQTVTLESNPEITVTLKRVGVGLRLRIETELAEQRFRQFELTAGYRMVLPEGQKLEDLSVDDRKKIWRIDQEYDRISQAVSLHWQKSLIVEILDADKTPINVDVFLESGDPVAVSEIQSYIDSGAKLNADQAKNSERPTTSQESVDGPTNSTTASTAETEATTQSASA